MKSKKTGLLIIVSVVLAFAYDTGRAQIPAVHRANYTGPLEYSFPKMTYFPPLSIGMPFDVMIGYIYLDSVARTVPMSVIDSAFGDYRSSTKLGAIGYSDTLRYLAKYFYEVDDYDPIRFSQYSNLLASG